MFAPQRNHLVLEQYKLTYQYPDVILIFFPDHNFKAIKKYQ